jgi:hypothetical protein
MLAILVIGDDSHIRAALESVPKRTNLDAVVWRDAGAFAPHGERSGAG